MRLETLDSEMFAVVKGISNTTTTGMPYSAKTGVADTMPAEPYVPPGATLGCVFKDDTIETTTTIDSNGNKTTTKKKDSTRVPDDACEELRRRSGE